MAESDLLKQRVMAFHEDMQKWMEILKMPKNKAKREASLKNGLKQELKTSCHFNKQKDKEL